jgi:hypothetical protein
MWAASWRGLKLQIAGDTWTKTEFTSYFTCDTSSSGGIGSGSSVWQIKAQSCLISHAKRQRRVLESFGGFGLIRNSQYQLHLISASSAFLLPIRHGVIQRH